MGSLSMFLNLPMPVKAAIFVVTGGGIMGLMYILMMSGIIQGSLGYLLLIAMAIAAAVFGIYKFFSKRMEKRKAKPFEQKMADSASATPTGVSDPNSRAKLDDLRKRFEEGIQVFKEHGKDLYTMPWYVIVGEPGSGKTEAMRHSNVGFPPGLQDQLQGVGGTVNMHWWFTNQSVMIDTAGRLMFDDIEPGNVNEWGEFLKMLRTARPNCPLNGMLLVIPADSLIKDSANDLERKGGKIAQQLDNIQRALGVRFPVYIVISKADRINGFREFFEELTDPVMQMQMMGWTNPNDLDTPFDPSMVEQHLKSVRERLVRRRFSLLADPVNSDDPMGQRIDQVDALYAFPDSLVKLSPRLRRYLEMVFVAGEWSQKPLFLRGIYFTSSMREGDALDADLADVLGVQVDALREGKLWERDRSYFLKDVFMEKVFREKGLVTRESNVGKSRRRQSVILLTAGTLLAVGAGLWTYFASARLEQSIDGTSRDMAAIAEMISPDLVNDNDRQTRPSVALVQPFSGFYLGVPTAGESGGLTRIKLQRDAKFRADSGIKKDPIFWFASAATGDLSERLKEAQSFLFDQYALRAFVNEARARIGKPHRLNSDAQRMSDAELLGVDRGAEWWSDHAVDALTSLLEIESVGTDEKLVLSEVDYRRWLESFSNYPSQLPGEYRRFLQSEDEDKTLGWENLTEEDKTFLVGVLFERFGAEGDGLAEALGGGTEQSQEVIRRGVESFQLSWTGGDGGQATLLSLLNSFSEAARAYQTAESAVIRFTGFENAQTSTAFESARDEWSGLVTALHDERVELEAVLNTTVAKRSSAGAAQESTLLENLMQWTSTNLKTEAKQRATQVANDRFGQLAQAIPETLTVEDEGSAKFLAEMRQSLETARLAYLASVDEEIDNAMSALIGDGNGSSGLIATLIKSGDSNNVLYVERLTAIDAVRDYITKPVTSAPDVAAFASAIDTLSSHIKEEQNKLPASGEDSRAGLTGSVTRNGLSAYQAYIATHWVKSKLNELPDTDFAQVVKERAEDPNTPRRGADFNLSVFPWLGDRNSRLEPSFDDVVAADVLTIVGNLGRIIESDTRLLDVDELSSNWQTVSALVDVYRAAYIGYWMTEVPKKYKPTPTDGSSQAWANAIKTISMNQDQVFEGIYSITNRSIEALQAVEMSPTAGSAVQKYLATLELDALGFKVGSLEKGVGRVAASEMIYRWTRLTDNFQAAWRDLREDLDAPGENIRSTYFAACVEAPTTPARVYWAGVAEIMLKAVQISVDADGTAKRDAVWALGKKFPISRDGSNVGEMTADEFESFQDLVAWFDSAVTAERAAVGSPVTGLPPSVARMLDAVRRGQTLQDRDKEVLSGAKDVVRWIQGLNEGGSQGLTIHLVQLDDEVQFRENHQYVRILRGNQPVEVGDGEKPGQRQGTYRTVRSETTEALLTLPVPSEGAPIDFLFWANSQEFRPDGQPKARGSLSMPWHGLRAISDGRLVDGNWVVPLRMESGAGPFSVRVGGLTAPPDSWPTLADWD